MEFWCILVLNKLNRPHKEQGSKHTCSILCDPDGWILRVNKEAEYPHFFHLFPAQDILTVDVTGDVLISYIGFGSKGSPHPPLYILISK